MDQADTHQEGRKKRAGKYLEGREERRKREEERERKRERELGVRVRRIERQEEKKGR